MPAPQNMLKSRLAQGEVLHGIWLGFADAYAADIAASAGFDWLLIDAEHAPNDMRSILAQLQVLAGSSALPIVRLPDDDPTKIKQALDIGAQSLVIPMIESKAQAERALSASRYAPQGFRGVGSALARASRFSAIPDYLSSANEQVFVMLQVETVKGLEALDEILSIEDLDAVFIGPSDLAADMGYLGNPAAPAVKAAVLSALARIRAAGKSAGVLTTDPAYIAAAKDAGANFVGVGIDVTLLSAALRGLAAQYR